MNKYVPSEAIENAKKSSFRWIMDLFLLALVAVIVLGIVQAVFLYQSQDLQNQQISMLTANVSLLNMQDGILLANISEVNMTNMDKIQSLRVETYTNITRLQMDIDLLEDILNVSGTGAQSFSEVVINNFTMVNNELFLLQGKDMTLMGNVTTIAGAVTLLDNQLTTINNNLSTMIQMRMKSINGVNASVPGGDFFLTPLVGVAITPSASPNTLEISNTGVITVLGQTTSGGNIHFVPQCGLNITAGPMSHEVTFDACALANDINNIDMTVTNQGMQITTLNATDVNLQMQIDALTMSGEIIANMTGMDLSGVNMTLNQLITQVMILQMEVDNLQNVISQANNTYVPRGSIIPYGGLAAPTGYLLCDGTLVQTSVYPDLFALVGNDFCIASCPVGFFALPDMRGRVPAAQNGATFTMRGTRVGNEMETLSLTHIPAHTHTISSSGTHQHSVMLGQAEHYNAAPSTFPSYCSTGVGRDDSTATAVGQSIFAMDGFQAYPPGGCNTLSSSGNTMRFAPDFNNGAPYGVNGAEPGGDHNHGGATGSAGSGSAHPNIQPTLTVGSYIIKW